VGRVLRRSRQTPQRRRPGVIGRHAASGVAARANVSCSLWSRTLASNAGPAKTVIGSRKGPTQTMARRLRYGVTRTDTSDCSVRRGRDHCRDMRIHRVNCCAQEQAAGTRVLLSGLLLWLDGERDPARKASRPARTGNRRPVRWCPPTDNRDTLWHRSFRCPRAHSCGITCSTRTVAAALGPPRRSNALIGPGPLPRVGRGKRLRRRHSLRRPGHALFTRIAYCAAARWRASFSSSL
jgi:hypothetical protein